MECGRCRSLNTTLYRPKAVISIANRTKYYKGGLGWNTGGNYQAFVRLKHSKADAEIINKGITSIIMSQYMPMDHYGKFGILQLRKYGHQTRNHAEYSGAQTPKTEHELSAREIEVLILITKGLINKEIADKLNISLTTVISHRKNITEKLGIKSVSGLTVYAVMNGYIEADRI